MKLKYNLFIRCLILFSFFQFSSNIRAQNFEKINEYVSEEKTEIIRDLARKSFENFERTGAFEHKLMHHFLLAFSEPIDVSVDKRITNLLWVIEHARNEDKQLLAYSNYHLASLLIYLNSNRTATPFAQKAISLARQCNEIELMYLSYSLIGSIHYNLKNYTNAIKYYEKALYHCQHKNTLFKASTYNNISLCKMNQNDLDASNTFILKSLQVLKIVSKTEDAENFQAIVEGNLGSNYYKQNKLDDAIQLLEKELSLYIRKSGFELESIVPLTELLEIYTSFNNQQKIQETIERVKLMKNRLKNSLKAVQFTELLYKYNLDKQNLPEIRIYGNQFFQQTKEVRDSLVASAEKLNSLLYDKQVQTIRNEFNTKNRLLNVTNKNNHKTNLILWISLTAICLIFIILYIEKSRREKRNRVILTQQKLLEENKSLLLQQEVKLKQEKITSLALNLNLKKETEKAFLEKIKEIKRHRIVDTESILKELQLSVTNLVQIGLKSNVTATESEEENLKFIHQLKATHPILTEQELNLCVYFRLNLNSKEIANLSQMTSGTIRVYKTKIKQKLLLNSDQNLSLYLQQIE